MHAVEMDRWTVEISIQAARVGRESFSSWALGPGMWAVIEASTVLSNWELQETCRFDLRERTEVKLCKGGARITSAAAAQDLIASRLLMPDTSAMSVTMTCGGVDCSVLADFISPETVPVQMRREEVVLYATINGVSGDAMPRLSRAMVSVLADIEQGADLKAAWMTAARPPLNNAWARRLLGSMPTQGRPKTLPRPKWVTWTRLADWRPELREVFEIVESTVQATAHGVTVLLAEDPRLLDPRELARVYYAFREIVGGPDWSKLTIGTPMINVDLPFEIERSRIFSTVKRNV